MRRLGRIVVRAAIVASFLLSGSIVVLKLRTLDGRWNRLEHTTDGGVHWRIFSGRNGLVVAWAAPWPAGRHVVWEAAGDDASWLIDGARGEPMARYWIQDMPAPRGAVEAGPAIRRGHDYVYAGGDSVGRARWVRVHAPHGMAAALAALPFATAAAAGVLRWDRRRRRRRAGQCPRCGYDVRATPQRCPECGAVSRSGGSALHATPQ